MLHPESCARYVDCRNRNTLIGNYQEECAYPQLFDSFNNSCKPYREVKCGNRPEPKAPCEYIRFRGVIRVIENNVIIKLIPQFIKLLQ